MFFVLSIWAVSCKYLLSPRILLMFVFQKFEWLNLEHVCRVVSILFPGVESIHNCSISIPSFCILHSLLQARHQRPILASLSGVDDVDKFRFERGAAYEETVDVRLECYFRLQSASVIPQSTTSTYRVRRSWNQRRSLRTRFGSIRRSLARWPWQGRRERRVEFLGPAKPSKTA